MQGSRTGRLWVLGLEHTAPPSQPQWITPVLLLTTLLLASGAPSLPRAGATALTCDTAAATPATLALSFEQFDQDLARGWRSLGNGLCYREAAALIRRYRSANDARLAPSQRAVLSWHEGQMYASAGDAPRAVPLLLGGVPADDSNGFADYALGTVAFLHRDRDALARARARLALLPRPADWATSSVVSMTVDGVRMVGVVPWPPNLNVLDGLLACWDRPYAVAHAPPCTQSFKLRRDTTRGPRSAP